ncbi:MAG: beta-ketoacyl-ACP synthase II [Kiritimatiellaeota bacterium]|nr:beta-ketoacyl-ACP synthase II [Kiritimatiellota bacterium]
MNSKRVVVTGAGAITSVGNSREATWRALVDGECGIASITHFDASDFRSRIAGEVKNFDIANYMSPKEARRLDAFCHYAIAATDEALDHAGISKELDGINPERVGVLVGSGIGGMGTMEKQAKILHERGPTKSSPLLVPMMIIDMSSGALSMRYGAKGPNFGVVTACATGSHSIGESYWIIKRGDADVMITGGAEATITPLGFTGFCAMKALSQRNDDPQGASRPFDAERDGFVMSEGAGVIILEELEHAKRRGANIIGEIAGYGVTADAYHITSPSPGGEGAARAIKMALNHAQLDPADLDYINAHGTSTALNDKFETAAFKLALGEENARGVSISSTKGATGHALGAAGGIEIIACIEAIGNGVVPPTINYENPDPECDLNYTPNTAEEKDIAIALNTNLGFGGHNAAIIIKAYQP